MKGDGWGVIMIMNIVLSPKIWEQLWKEIFWRHFVEIFFKGGAKIFLGQLFFYIYSREIKKKTNFFTKQQKIVHSRWCDVGGTTNYFVNPCAGKNDKYRYS